MKLLRHILQYFASSTGKAKYDPKRHALVWKIKKVGRDEFMPELLCVLSAYCTKCAPGFQKPKRWQEGKLPWHLSRVMLL